MIVSVIEFSLTEKAVLCFRALQEWVLKASQFHFEVGRFGELPKCQNEENFILMKQNHPRSPN